MQYNRQITIEANAKNRKGGTNNSFSVTFPNVKIPKGANMNISGCIIEEKGASNGSILELSDKNISKTQQYNSCTQRLKFNYYITNNGYQSVACPFVFKNGYTSYDGTVENTDLDAITHNAYLSLAQSYNPQDNAVGTYEDVDYAHYDDRSFVELKVYTPFFSDKDNQPVASADNDNLTGDLIDSPASVYCAHKTVKPDGVKYILCDPTNTEPSDINDFTAMEGTVDINLKDSLLQTPDEISYRINTALQSSEPNLINNNVNVEGLPVHEGTETIPQDYKPIFNFTSQTVRNIPSNLQVFDDGNGGYMHPIYSNMAVRNLNKWEGGQAWLNCCDFAGTVNFENWDLTNNQLDQIFRNSGSSATFDKQEFYPLLMGASYSLDKPILNFGLLSWRYIAPNGNHFHISFLNNNNGNPIQAPFTHILANLQPDGSTLHSFVKQVIDPFDNSKIALELYEPDNPFAVGVTLIYTNGPLEATIRDIDINHRNIKILNQYIDINAEPVAVYLLQGDQTATADYQDDIIYNGLPYITVHPQNSGGRKADHMNDTTNYLNHVNEYLAIPEYYALPSNILFTDGHAANIAKFFRKNEIYIGNATTFEEQQADNENWIVELDLGFNDSYLSTKNIYPKVSPTAGQFLKSTADASSNFSFYGPWFPNMISQFNNRNRNVTLPDPKLNKNFPLQVYPLNSKSDMGSDLHTAQNTIWIYSRYHENTSNSVTMSNQGNNFVNSADNSTGTVLEMTTRYISAGYELEKDLELAKKYNIMVLKANYNNCNNGFVFVNAFPTLDGNGQGVVDYTLGGRSANFRTSFRICCGCYFGFDPSPLINNFIIPMNRQQTNTADNARLVRQWDVADYYPDDDDHAKYSSFIEDYINFVWVGAVNPQINFNTDRFQILNFHTPRLFNQEESKSSGIAVGSEISIFNEQDQPFQVLRVFENATGINNIKSKSVNFGIADSITGLFLVGLEVQDEDGNYKECSFNDKFTETINYEGCLFSRLGFELKQFLFPYGRQDKRFNLFHQANLTDKKYEYCRFFTTEGFLNQGIDQLLSIYGANQPDNAAAGGVNIRGLPQYFNGYVGLQQFVISCESFKVRALKLPARLINSYYRISTSLPSTGYISNNNFINCNAYVYKQYRTGNFFFSYASDQIFTATQEFILSNLQIDIKNNNGVLASNLGENNTIFFKISYPQKINTVPQININSTDSTLLKINENIKDLEKLRVNPKAAVAIGQNAQRAVGAVNRAAQTVAAAYAPPVPLPPVVMGVVVPNTNPRFPITNPATGAQIISTAQPEQKEDTAEIDTKEPDVQIIPDLAPFPLEDPVLYAVRKGQIQAEAQARSDALQLATDAENRAREQVNKAEEARSQAVIRANTAEANAKKANEELIREKEAIDKATQEKIKALAEIHRTKVEARALAEGAGAEAAAVRARAEGVELASEIRANAAETRARERIKAAETRAREQIRKAEKARNEAQIRANAAETRAREAAQELEEEKLAIAIATEVKVISVQKADAASQAQIETKEEDMIIETNVPPFPLEDPFIYATRKGQYQEEAAIIEIDQQKNIIYNNMDLMLQALEEPPEDAFEAYQEYGTLASEAERLDPVRPEPIDIEGLTKRKGRPRQVPPTERKQEKDFEKIFRRERKPKGEAAAEQPQEAAAAASGEQLVRPQDEAANAPPPEPTGGKEPPREDPARRPPPE